MNGKVKMIEKILKRAALITVILLIPIFGALSINYFIEEDYLKAIVIGLSAIFCVSSIWVYLETGNDVN